MSHGFQEVGRLGTSAVFIVFFGRLYVFSLDRCGLYLGFDLHLGRDGKPQMQTTTFSDDLPRTFAVSEMSIFEDGSVGIASRSKV